MSNTTWIEPPPPQKGMGCFAKGCLILLVFVIVLILACCAGLYWGFRHHSALVHGFYWLTKTHAIGSSPMPVPSYEASEAEIETVKERWRNFESAGRDHQPAEIELTGNDINDLIAANRHWRGKAFVSIEGNRLRLQASVPLDEFVGQSGYYFNGDIAIQSDEAMPLDNPRLESVTVNNKPVPRDVLDWKYRSRQLRDYLAEYKDAREIGKIQIRDGKLTLRSRGE
ncbi:MAG TPA: hypothetical protein DCG89_00210 [Spartobacteria bacterium]|jgi:hypothetical protein|nr:hypothetical protein [Spartobacteria bacterium]